MAERWYAVHSRPRMEALALENLQNQAFHAWLPQLRRRVRRKGRWAQVVEPLFARYLFLRVDPQAQDISPVRSTKGVVNLVRQAGVPVPVPDPVMAALFEAVDQETGLHCLSDSVAPALAPGSPVRVLEGPFAGMEGVFQKASGEARALVLLAVLGAPTSVKLSRNDLAPLGAS